MHREVDLKTGERRVRRDVNHIDQKLLFLKRAKCMRMEKHTFIIKRDAVSSLLTSRFVSRFY
jgi:hypothetical protein